MKKYILVYYVVAFFLFSPALLFAQDTTLSDEHLQVEHVILKLFDGMREGDSAKVASVFDPEVKMYTSYVNQQGEMIIKKGALPPFLTAIGSPHDQIWDEKIWDTKISLDVGIAQVWTNYAFYVGTEFSHCGVDAFHLIKDASNGWRIVHLMDTRTKEKCDHEHH